MKHSVPIAAALSLVTIHAWPAGAATSAPAPTLHAMPDVTQGVAAFPRLEGNSKGVAPINAALEAADKRAAATAKSCHDDAAGKGRWTRSIGVTLLSARFVSFLVHDDYYCGGPYPDTSEFALVYDLASGAPVDWSRLIPGTASQSAEVAADETPLVTVSSPQLTSLFKGAAGGVSTDPECKEVLEGGDQPMQFLVWPDAKTKGLSIAVAGLPHAARACGGPVTIPAGKLKELHADSALIDDILAGAAGSSSANQL
jgi:hypothetical protein